MLLFLDFDGVLHPAPPYNRDMGVFCHLERFEAVMREFSDWEIVISSSWREQFELDELRGFFSPDIACRIVGVTPVFLTVACGRQREIERYLNTQSGATHWIALDDAAHEFEPGLSCLVVCQSEVGLDERAAADLWMKMGEVAKAG